MQQFNGYYPPGQSYMQPQYYNPQPAQPQTSGIIWVQGEEGEKVWLNIAEWLGMLKEKKLSPVPLN